jgi:hypothetical protein
MDDGDAWASSHQTGDDFIPRYFDPHGSEYLHHKGKNEGNGYGLSNDRILKRWIMHLHVFPLGIHGELPKRYLTTKITI